MREPIYGNQFRKTIVCIDAYDNGNLNGRMYNPYFDAGITFRSTMEFLKKMDSMLEKMNFPQSFSINRVFQPISEIETLMTPSTEPKRGKSATFAVSVLFRQNASWQGSVTWLEENREESFRSVLELLFLMDSALVVSEEI